MTTLWSSLFLCGGFIFSMSRYEIPVGVSTNRSAPPPYVFLNEARQLHHKESKEDEHHESFPTLHLLG